MAIKIKGSCTVCDKYTEDEQAIHCVRNNLPLCDGCRKRLAEEQKKKLEKNKKEG